MGKNAFVCWRPFQLLTAINLVANGFGNIGDSTNDLYLLNSKALKNVGTSLMDSGLFDSVIYFDEAETRGYKNSTFVTMVKFVFPKRTIRKSLGKTINTKYDTLFASGWMPFFVCLCEVNPKARVIFFEDGFSSYTSVDDIKENTTTRNKLFYRVTGRGKLSVHIQKQLLYKPEWKRQSAFPVEKIPELSDTALQLCKKVFGFTVVDSFQKARFVFLDQPIDSLAGFNTEYSRERVLGILSAEGKVLVRLHPNQKSEPIEKHECDAGVNLWELEAVGMDSGKVLISVHSTATVTPYTLYGNLPTIILLYKLAFKKDSYDYRIAEEIGSMINDSYPGKKFIPESYEDLALVLGQI